MPIDQATKLMVLKVKGRFSTMSPQPEVAGFHGLTGATTKRRRVGEVFEILSTPYKREKSYYKRNEDDFKRVKTDGDPREAIAAHMVSNHGWTDEMAVNYQKLQYFDPETMELLEELPSESEDNDLSNDHLLELPEAAALKLIKKEDGTLVLQAWLEAEKVNPNGPRAKVISALTAALEN